MATTIKIEGIEQLSKKLDRLQRPAYLQGVLEVASRDIYGKTSQYPPSTEANSPNNSSGRWYERGYGQRWVNPDGSSGGTKTSQTLSKKWSIKVEKAKATIANAATYAIYLHSRDKQVAWAKERGWLAIEDVAEQEIDNIEQKLQQVVEDMLNKD